MARAGKWDELIQRIRSLSATRYRHRYLILQCAAIIGICRCVMNMLTDKKTRHDEYLDSTDASSAFEPLMSPTPP